jgi:transposase-like protein
MPGATGEARCSRQHLSYLNNLIDQDHRAIRRIMKMTLGFNSFRSAAITLAGIEIMHMIKKGQMSHSSSPYLTLAQQFYSLAA